MAQRAVMRDPRIDPKEGDILEVNGHAYEVVLTNTHGAIVARPVKGKVRHRMQWSPATWRITFGGATVVRRGEGS